MLRDAAFRLLRTSSFRLAIQSAILSAFGAILVFAIIYHASENAVRSELDSTVSSEAADVISDAKDDASFLKSVQIATAESDGTFYALTAEDGTELAGNVTISPKAAALWSSWRTIKPTDGINLPAHITAIRGLATRLSNGDTLYVAENASALQSLNHLIRDAFVTVFGVILVIGVASGLLVARGALRRIEAISETSREIMAGDLSRRIKLAGTRDEFDRLAENLNLMLARIQSLMENVQQVSNDIAHDLRSPLARLREHLELAAEKTTDMATRSEIEEGIEQVDSALEIFAALLRIAEVEAGARRRDFNMVDLSALLRDLADTFETVADAASMNLSTDISDGLNVDGDRELLTQMFVNIIENAIRHSPSGSRINIIAKSQGPGRLEVLISDTGPGIPADQRARVLRRFVKLDASRHRRGTGLGLSLSLAVAELHNGCIKLSGNEPGLRVAIALPAAQQVLRGEPDVQILKS
jgi:signal transduction histidine kinase